MTKLIDTALEQAEEIIQQIAEDYPELDENDTRQATVYFGLFTELIHVLRDMGWTEQELLNEFNSHNEIYKKYK